MKAPKQPQPQHVTADAMKALAERLLQATAPGKPPTVPKKVPAVDDIAGQTKAVGAALADALVTATDTPVTVLQPFVGAIASQLVALGIRQTEHVDPDAVHAPAWIVQGMREQSTKVPEPPRPAEAPPAVVRTAKAPTPPKRIRNAARAVRR